MATPALAKFGSPALREQFLLEDITALDDLMLDHQRKHALVTECKGKFKRFSVQLSLICVLISGYE